MDEQRHLLKRNFQNKNSSPEESSEHEEWTDSSDSSYYSDSDSSIPEWDSSVDERTGEVLYIECHSFVTQNNPEPVTPLKDPFSKSQIRQSTRGKFLRLIRRRESKRYSKRNLKHSEHIEVNKVKFQDFHEGEEREVLLNLTSKNKVRFDKNPSIESLLGINVSTLSDGNRLMVAGFLPDSAAKYEKNIKIGDWLKSINGIEVHLQNVKIILQQVVDKNEVLLQLQRVAGVDVTKNPPINELNNQSPFVRQLIGHDDFEENLYSILLKNPIGVVYLNTNVQNEELNNEFEDVTYCFPQPKQRNILCSARGIFLTLNHLLYDFTKTRTKTTSIRWQGKLCHICYTNYEKALFLLMLPDSCAKLTEIVLITEEILRMVSYVYKSLDECFNNEMNLHQMDRFFSIFFTRMLCGGEWVPVQKFLEDADGFKGEQYHFEEILPAALMLNLPNEAEMQIDDALTELEACDYREWNDEPLNCQRLFTMLGSAWYHSGYLLMSHLTHEDLLDVHIYCRQQGLLHLSKSEPVKTLVAWRRVFPNCLKDKDKVSSQIIEGKHYLLIVGSAKDLLVVLMEAGGCTEPAEESSGPDPFYVEEAQATLAHLQELGLPELADRFIATNPGPQVTIPMASTKKRLDLASFAARLNKDPSPAGVRKHEVTSILKRRSTDFASSYSLVDDASSYDARSEDTESQGGYSEVSDEPSVTPHSSVRRSSDKLSKYDSDGEESEMDNADGSQMSANSFDVSELRQILLSETEDVRPIQITSGVENVLFHFVQFDKIEGVLIGPPECSVESQTREAVISNFGRCCQQIHSVFQNTIRFKEMTAQEMAKSVINKSLIAIKEQGVMFECPFLDEKDPKKSKINYWVIGRLFFVPHLKEVYVCYNDSVPQNLVELAFKMNGEFLENQ